MNRAMKRSELLSHLNGVTMLQWEHSREENGGVIWHKWRPVAYRDIVVEWSNLGRMYRVYANLAGHRVLLGMTTRTIALARFMGDIFRNAKPL